MIVSLREYVCFTSVNMFTWANMFVYLGEYAHKAEYSNIGAELKQNNYLNVHNDWFIYKVKKTYRRGNCDELKK